MNNIHTFIICLAVIATLLVGCESNPQSPGYEYMPDMYRTPSVETYQEDSTFEYGMSALQPVEGTIPRGHEIYPYENTSEGYELAGAELKNPIPCTPLALAQGQELYTKFCLHCHGAGGAGDGKVASNPKWPGPPPAYNGAQLKDLPEGKIFHSITYGKGMMGSHSSQLNQKERWKLVHYVQALQGKDKSCNENKTEMAEVNVEQEMENE